ncbi:MAG: enoyl-CoA hydratase-related protein [Thermoplasmata archaeon]|nr:enoyl-CoA hydratase-related protein [Thermoplasmata archaeon]
MGRTLTESFRTERRGAVLEIRLNRPDRLNALDIPSFRALRVALQDAAHDASVRAVLLTGEGRAFCAGGDVAAMEEHRQSGRLPQFFKDLTGEQELSVREIMGMSKPVLASLPGVAAGGGLSLALAADWRIAAEGAQLVPAFPALGAVPDGGLTYLLPHFLGLGLAQELLFTNARVSAERAREMGLLHEVVAPDALGARSWERAAELADGPTFAYGWMKRLLVAAFSQSLEAQLSLERRGAVEAALGKELPEGIRAFREKRKPIFPAPVDAAAPVTREP